VSALDWMPLWALYASTAAVALLATWAGLRLGRRDREQEGHEPEAPLGTIVSALLGLLAFMLAFTFSSSAGRYDARRELVLEEANAIGTAYLRADLLPEPQRGEIRRLLREYVDLRVAPPDRDQLAAAIARSEEIHSLLWAQLAAVTAPQSVVMVSLNVQALNAVIDLHTSRVTVVFEHRIPGTVWLTLAGVTLLSILTVGYYAGLMGRKRVTVAVPFVLAFCGVLALIADLDRVDASAIAVSQRAMLELQGSMR
jgi:hypothetical protein